MKDKTNQKYWQRIAKIYAPLMESDNAFYERICQNIEPYLHQDMNVLELACGSGQLSFPLSNKVNQWTATDFSEKMIQEANKRGVTDNLHFCIADATKLSFENDSFDCVVIANALHIMPYPEMAMYEIIRVLKSGGVLYAPTFLWKEGKASALRKRLMALSGFHTYHEWDQETFQKFIASFGFHINDISILEGGVAPAGMLIATKE